jgi:RluA family pseudouridine synthase
VLTTIEVPADRAGERLDALLHGVEVPELGPLSRTKARDLCAIAAVAVDGVLAGPTTRVQLGEQVAFAADTAVLSLALRIPVAAADAAFVVLQKPPGLAVHKGPLVEHSVADALAAHLPGAGLAQRLDREASGLLLVGRDSQALAALGRAMERGEVTREYLAVVVGVPTFDQRTIDLPLRVTDEPRGDRPKTVVDAAGQIAVSHVTVVARRKQHALLRVRLETGRTHQIRAHLAAIGHPLLGDPRYGDPTANAAAKATFGTDRTLLHGARLVFPHPAHGAEVEVAAQHEPDFVRLFPNLRRQRGRDLGSSDFARGV